MIRILKNYERKRISNMFRGRIVTFGSKAGIGFDLENEEQKALYNFWKETYGFIQDITDREDLKKRGGNL